MALGSGGHPNYRRFSGDSSELRAEMMACLLRNEEKPLPCSANLLMNSIPSFRSLSRGAEDPMMSQMWP